ncbi:MAG: glycosyltransferase [Flavobacteriia bacterium]|jgi:cellulose synthase/poly-beta-1,6-N-acetylglucosamine synthase-like glycosyltransferase|nr:glycosyltransferase [Cryomorphaceae bacterium]NDE04024.1 glycosyltransferase [Flavobacteriia bacterium]
MKNSLLLLFFGLFIAFSSHAHKDLAIPVSKKIEGFLVDFKTKSEVEEVEVQLKSAVTGKVYTTETDENGKFTFRNVPIGKSTIKLIDKDYRAAVLKVFETNAKEHLVHYTFSQTQPFSAQLKVSWLFNWGDYKGQEHYWSHMVARIILVIYGLCLVLIFFYSVIQLSLAIAYVRNKKKQQSRVTPPFDLATAPKVTVQLPMFNEMYVAERIIETCAEMDYPRDKFQIQVLDDSTDETKDIIANKCAEVAARGINIQHVHRTDRTGYKAGALDCAMDKVEGEFIAIFDADFVPSKDFLLRTIPYFTENVGVVQTRWGHLNKDYSLLTELQAFGLNGHFAIEQGGRNASGHYINFNGTAGVWRRATIDDAGGWEHDTITEDLDLSYRAQMKGWRFVYLEEVESPAELPITMSALKSQQHRWMKGGAEVFIKMWKRLATTKGLKIGDRIHGLAHLFNSSVFVFILILSLLSLAVLHIKDSFSDLNIFIKYGMYFFSSTIFLGFYYWNSFRDKRGNFFGDLFRFLGRFVQFLTVSMALGLSNAVAVIEGYLGIKSSFVRTPKFNVAKKDEFKGNKYDKKSLSIINIMEGIFMVTFGFTAVNRAIYGDLGMVPFHLMLAIGYGIIFFNTLKENRTQPA